MESSITPSHLQPSFVANGVSFGNTQYHYKNVMDNTWFKPLIVRAANKEWSNITEDDKRHCYNLIGEFVATWLGQMNREISKDPELEFNGPSLSTTLTYRNIIDEIADLFFEFPWEKADGKEPVDGDKHRSSTVFTPETLSNVFFNIITVPNKDVVNSCKMYGALRGATHSTSQNSSVVANQLKNYVSKTMRGDPDSTFWAEYSSEKIPIVPRQMLDAIKDDSREMRTMKSLMEHMRDGSDQSDMKTPLLTKFIQIHAPTKAPFAQNLLMRPFSGTYEGAPVRQVRARLRGHEKAEEQVESQKEGQASARAQVRVQRGHEQHDLALLGQARVWDGDAVVHETDDGSSHLDFEVHLLPARAELAWARQARPRVHSERCAVFHVDDHIL
jgi:hypothetical protein